jgi:hypothetical protein
MLVALVARPTGTRRAVKPGVKPQVDNLVDPLLTLNKTFEQPVEWLAIPPCGHSSGTVVAASKMACAAAVQHAQSKALRLAASSFVQPRHGFVRLWQCPVCEGPRCAIESLRIIHRRIPSTKRPGKCMESRCNRPFSKCGP